MKLIVILLLLLPGLVYAQPPGGGGPPGGKPVVKDYSINAKNYLACDGISDDSALFKALVETGDAAGKTLFIPATCSILLGSPGASAASVTLPPNTSIICERGAQPHFKLARRYCSGGNTPNAACPGGSGDCNGGTCVYDIGSTMYANSGASTYTVFKGPTDAACTGTGTPWLCCRASGQGNCDGSETHTANIGVIIDGCTVATNQIEPWGRCANGGAENGKACATYCTAGTSAGFNCDDGTADCGGSTCEESLCPSAVNNGQCSSAPLAPSGTGTINVFDFQFNVGVTINNATILDLAKGTPIQVGLYGQVSNTNTYAQSLASNGIQYGRIPVGMPAWANTVLDIEHPFGIVTGSSTIISNVRTFGDTAAIRVGGFSKVSNVFVAANPEASAIGVDTNGTVGSSFSQIQVDTLSGTSAIGLRETGANSAENVNITVSGASGKGVELSGGGSVQGGTITVTGASAYGAHTSGSDALSAGNVISGLTFTGSSSAASQIGVYADERRVRVLGNSFKTFTGNNTEVIRLSGDSAIADGNTYFELGRVGIGIKIQGLGAIATNNIMLAGGARECIHAEINLGTQNIISNNYMDGCYIGVSPYVGGTINYTVMGNRMYAQEYAGVIGETGAIIDGNYIAFGTGNCIGTAGDEGLGCKDSSVTSTANNDADDVCGGSTNCRAAVAIMIGDQRRPEETTYADWNAVGGGAGHMTITNNVLSQDARGTDFDADVVAIVLYSDPGLRCNSGTDAGKACTTSGDCNAAAVCDRTFISGTTAPGYSSTDFSGNVFVPSAKTDFAVDLGTSIETGDDSGSTNAITISKILLGEGVCDSSSTDPDLGCYKFPSTSTGNVTGVAIGGVAYDRSGVPYRLNWNDTMGFDLNVAHPETFTLSIAGAGGSCQGGSSAYFSIVTTADNICDATESNRSINAGAAWTADGLICAAASNTSTCDVIFTLRKTGADTALTCTSTDQVTCSSSGTISYSSSDTWDVKTVETGSNTCPNTVAMGLWCLLRGHWG